MVIAIDFSNFICYIVIYMKRQLNQRQKNFAKIRVQEPHLTNAEVSLKAGYNSKAPATLSQQAYELMKKPEIKLEMAKWSNEAENTVYKVMTTATQRMEDDERNGATWGNLARQSADSILDRVHGKATQRVESTNTSLSLSIDLSGVNDNRTDS